jgi:hypothetical protein
MRVNQFVPGYVSQAVKVESKFTDYELAVMEGGLSLDKPKSALHQAVTEAFDQPYKILRWENSEHYGDVDAIARLDDNSFLSIMFNMEYDEEGKEVIQVEFHRNNSQEVTGDGDAQRVFATVLAAIQQYIKEHNPKRLTFSASKEVKPDQNSESRAKLYDRLVQRYARTWGYRPLRADTGSIVRYELSRIKPMAEGDVLQFKRPGLIQQIKKLVKPSKEKLPTKQQSPVYNPKEFRSDTPKENLEEIDRRGFLKGMGAVAMASAAGSVKAANFQSLTPQQKDIVMQVIWSWIFTIDKEGKANELPFTSELTRFINIYDGSKKWVLDSAKNINFIVKKRKSEQDPNEFYAESRKLRANAQDYIDDLKELNDLGEEIKQQTQQTSSNIEAKETIKDFTVIYGPGFLSSNNTKLKQRFRFHLKNQIDQLPDVFLKKISNVNIYIGSGDLPHNAWAFYVTPRTWLAKGFPKDAMGEGGNIVVGNWGRGHLNIIGNSILIHELSHAYQYADPSINNLINVAYKNAMENKLYSNTYTSKNPSEYFAELTSMYFGESGEPPFNKQGLKKYDPTGYNMIEVVWGLMKEGVDNTVEENFADGKVKGKSRPGRVERSGASCDGSVSDLRSKAKNASGERAKMYHWCANMKNGRAKNESEMLEDLNVIWKDVLEAGVYKGYPCTKDCSGHAAGYKWSDDRDITDPNQCPYSNNSFWEGCLAHTDEQE